jgi:hypothetical protein
MKDENGSPQRKMVIRVIIVVLTLSIVMLNADVIFGLLTTVLNINTTGVIASVNIKCYRESECLNSYSTIIWGTLNAGSSRSVKAYIKNEGNIPLKLSLTTADWNPQHATNYIFLTWDYSNTVLQPNDVLEVTFTLTVSGSIQGIDNFSFYIHLTAEET